MTRADPGLNCAEHPANAAIARCGHCGKPFCDACRVEDVAAEEVFCSRHCAGEHAKVRSGPALASEAALLGGSDQPIRTGWRLWARSLRPLCIYTAPYAIVVGQLSWWLAPETTDLDHLSVAAGWAAVASLSFGAALVQVVLSERHTGLVRGNPYIWTLRRFLPWVASYALAVLITYLGLVALILPGIYLALRLFWADEFALIHGANPIQALKESWNLTAGEAGAIFWFQFLVGLAMYLVLFIGAGLYMGFEFVAELLGKPFYLTSVERSVLFFLLFVGYAAIHAPEVVRFYAMRADRSRSLVASTKILNIT